MRSTSKILSASAGSGKTYSLVSEVLKLIDLEDDIPHLLATTFTRKAAGEIYEKLLFRILEEKVPKEPSILEKFILEQDHLVISTLDSFFISIAQSFSSELKLPRNWKIGEHHELDRIYSEALSHTVESLGTEQVLLLVPLLFRNEESLRVFSKLLDEITNISEEKLPTDPSIWNIPTQNKAATPISSLLSELEKTSSHPDTKKSLTNAIQKICDNAKRNAWEELLELTVFKNIRQGNYTLSRATIPEGAVTILEETQATALNLLIQDINNQGIAILGIISEFQKNLSEACYQQGIFSFSQITERVAKHAIEIPQSELFYRLDSYIKHLFVDEFQDTSLDQWNALQPLSSEIVQSPEGRMFLAVGDQKQAIYGWRGGVSEIFSHIQSLYTDGLEQITLSKSYRSSESIISFVNEVFSKVLENPSLQAHTAVTSHWDDIYSTHESALIDTPGGVLVESTQLDEIDEDILRTVNEFRSNKNEGDTLGVLVRNNKQALQVASLLEEADIPFSRRRGENIDSFYITQLVISLLTLCDHPKDRLSYVHLINSPLFDESTTLGELAQYVQHQFLKDGVSKTLIQLFKPLSDSLSRTEEEILKIIGQIARGADRKGLLRPSLIIPSLLNCTLPQEEMADINILTIHSSKGLEFTEVFIPYTHDAFYREQDIFLLKEQDNAFSSPTRISKSCRKEVRSIIPELDSMSSRWKDERVSESLCLSYVALTRAKQRLKILIPETDKKIGAIPTLSNLIRGALNFEKEVPSQSILYNSGSFDYSVVTAATSATPRNTLPRYLAGEIPNFAKTKSETFVSPSALNPKKEDLLASIFSKENSQLRSQGIQIHGFFEALTLYNNESELITEAKSKLELIEEDLHPIILQSLGSQTFASLFLFSRYKDSHCEVFNELPFALSIDDEIVTGRIDRVVLSKNDQEEYVRAEIVDFKFNCSSKDEVRPQLDSYKKAISELYSLSDSDITCTIADISKAILF